MSLTTIKGDLLESGEPVIAHGCNTAGAYAAGIAGQIAKRYPMARLTYERDARTRHFAPGAAQMVDVPGGITVFNLATQDQPGPYARLEWIYLAFRNMAEQCAYLGITRVAIPKIGCGIGGLEWPNVEYQIELAEENVNMRGHDLEIVVYEL